MTIQNVPPAKTMLILAYSLARRVVLNAMLKIFVKEPKTVILITEEYLKNAIENAEPVHQPILVLTLAIQLAQHVMEKVIVLIAY